MLFLNCFINGHWCHKDSIRKQLFGCRFLCHVQKSNQAPITVTTDLAKSTLVVWFTVMLVPSVAVEWCPNSNGVRLLKLTEAIPTKSPFCHGLFGKYLLVVIVVPRTTPKAELFRSELSRKQVGVVCLCYCNFVNGFLFDTPLTDVVFSQTSKPELTRDSHLFPKTPSKVKWLLETVVSLKNKKTPFTTRPHWH